MELRELRSKRLIVGKGLLFVCLGIVSAVLVVMEDGARWKRLVFLTVCLWAFCRAYYFAFHVIEHYVDPGFRFSGLLSAIRHLLGKEGTANRSGRDPS